MSNWTEGFGVRLKYDSTDGKLPILAREVDKKFGLLTEALFGEKTEDDRYRHDVRGLSNEQAIRFYNALRRSLGRRKVVLIRPEVPTKLNLVRDESDYKELRLVRE
jgi:hypothetical protein